MSVRIIVDPRLSGSGDRQRSRLQLTDGLLRQPASLPSVYLYDTLGSRLFAAITELPEYYLSRTESALLARHARQIAALSEDAATFIDLGAGDCKKAAGLLPLLQPSLYVGVDISAACLRTALQSLPQIFPQSQDSQITGWVTDFSAGLDWPPALPCERPFFFYPGSSIGNFSRHDAQDFLCGLHRLCSHTETQTGFLLMGVDLVKPVPVLEAAYADALGLTACFNLNILRHVNAVLGSDFDIRGFRHHARFDEQSECMEMSLIARSAQTVHWPGAERHFDAGETIITEHSYKYTPASVEKLLRSSGFSPLRQWMDDRGHYLLCLASAVR